jgi:hypothetical protein
LMSETKSHAHTKSHANVIVLYISSYVYRQQTRGQKSKPQSLVRLEGLGPLKNPMT